MYSYEEVELQGYLWFKENMDEEVQQLGGHDSTILDLYSPKYGNIEIKKIAGNSARCGQFTEQTLKYSSLGQKIINNNNKENVKNFVIDWYSKKECNGFLIYNGNSFSFYSFEEFFKNFHFSMQKPYKKRSGTRNVPKKDRDSVLNFNDDFFLKGENIMTENKNLFNTYFNIDDRQYYINKEGIVRKRSNTSNLTYHMEVFI